jgi:hypothetical protein
LRLQRDLLVSNFAFKFNILYRYTEVREAMFGAYKPKYSGIRIVFGCTGVGLARFTTLLCEVKTLFN